MSDQVETQFEYASVYLLDVPYCIDDAYDYFVPLDLRDKIKVGSFVTVPFGRGNRKQMGIVWAQGHCPVGAEAKPVDGVCSDRTPIDQSMLDICAFMKEQCLCTMGEAIRCVIPASALGKMSEYYYPVPDKTPDSSKGFTPADLFVYNYIFSSGGKSLESIKVKFGAANAESATSKLLAKGFVEKRLLTSRTMGEVFEKQYSLAITKDECNDILLGCGKIKLRSQKHKDVLGALMSAEKPMSAIELGEACDINASQIKALLEKGLLAVEEKRVWRDATDAGENLGVVPKEYDLNDEQRSAAEEIKGCLDSGNAGAILLFGVTGSGKTSVIIEAIDHSLNLGKGVIMLLPEIALTPQTVSILRQRYGKRVALIHSGLSAGERHDSYMRIYSGDADLVIGTRSAIFAPVKNLGLVIIDEEHETTYKSDISPKYHARDIARFRCAKSNAVMLLSSATPSIESYTKALEGKYKLLKLKTRYGGAELPSVEIYDMRREVRTGNTSPVGMLLKNELENVMQRDEQAILFLNRRGYNTRVSCKSCGEILTCPNCSISLNYHTRRGGYDDGYLFCHWCGYKSPVPRVCPTCSSEHLAKIGYGTQKIEQEISELLPNKRVARMDADSTSEKNSLREILVEFKEGRADVLLGTQMVTKGHDFPRVTLVGVLLADMSMYMDDYHANERTFSMLTQVIGRAGRSNKKGMAIIQTNNPDSDTIKLACKQDYEAFYASEIRLRKLLTFPPYCDIVLIGITGAIENQVLMNAKRIREELGRYSVGEYADVEMIMFGPFESPVYKVEGKYRMRIVIKCRLNRRSRELFSRILSDFGRSNKDKCAISINFNPTGL